MKTAASKGGGAKSGRKSLGPDFNTTNRRRQKSTSLRANQVFAQCVGNVTESHFDRMRALGVSDDVLRGSFPSMIGMAKIAPLAGGLFNFAEDGDPAVIVPACPYYEIGDLCPDDLVAFRTGEPGQWCRWRGDAVLLNESWTDRASLFEQPLFVAETPLSWLRNGAHGVCILDWNACLPLHLGRQPIIAETVELGRKIEDAYRRRYAAPPLRVAQQGIAA